MKTYCFRCGSTYSTKANLNKHLDSTDECEIKYLNLEKEEIKSHYDMHLNEFNELYHPEETDLICKDCNKVFKSSKGAEKHKKVCKKETTSLPDTSTNSANSTSLTNHSTSTMPNSSSSNNMSSLSNLSTLMNLMQFYDLHHKPESYNDLENYELNEFGEEKTISLTVGKLEDILKHNYDMLIKFIEFYYITTRENRNIYIENLSDSNIRLYHNKKWNLVNKDEFINELICINNIKLLNFISENRELLKNINYDCIMRIAFYSISDNTLKNDIKKNIELIFYNNKERVREIYEKKYGKKIT